MNRLAFIIALLLCGSAYAQEIQQPTCSISSGTITCPSGSLTPGTGSGTVTSVSVATANGVSGVVANPTTTPAITFTLGAITPSSISTSGQITSTLAIGTAPLVITSTTLVPNLYVARAVLADSATTNANLTGDVTSIGNATTLVTAQPGAHTWAAAQTINLNAAAALSPVTGTALQVIGADGVTGRVQATSFGTIASFTAARANGTGSSPTAVVSGNQIGGVNAYSYVTSASPGFVGPVASYQTFATENHTTTTMGSKAVIATTPNGSTTLTAALTVDQDQSVAMAGRATAATSFAIGGSTIGSNALAVTGSYQQFGGNFLLDGAGFQLRDNPATTTYMRMIGGTGFQLGNGHYIGFSSTANASGTIDTFTTRPAPATHQFGNFDAAVAVSQITRVQSVVAGTAAANGANWTLIGSLPTGTGTSGDIILQTGVKTGSGTTQGTATTGFTLKGETQVGAFSTALMVGSATPLTLTSGALGMQKMTASASAPGAAGTKFEAVCGTNSGTAKLVMYAGTSGTAVTVIDNVGAGVTGC